MMCDACDEERERERGERRERGTGDRGLRLNLSLSKKDISDYWDSLKEKVSPSFVVIFCRFSQHDVTIEHW